MLHVSVVLSTVVTAPTQYYGRIIGDFTAGTTDDGGF